MSFRIKNWKLTLLALVFIGIFTSLGMWQLSRANQKKILLKSFAERTAHEPMTAVEIGQPNDWRFYRAKLEGSFDNQHTMLLDNKTFHGKVGYEIYTPFKAKGLDRAILVDRGFIPIKQDRNEVQNIPDINGNVTIVGMLNRPPAYVALGQINESAKITWPLKIEYVNLYELSNLINYPLFSYTLSLEPKSPHTFEMEWQVVPSSPERNLGYAVQWFALALTLLILSVVLNRDR